jgi:hypothetical protein
MTQLIDFRAAPHRQRPRNAHLARFLFDRARCATKALSQDLPPQLLVQRPDQHLLAL